MKKGILYATGISILMLLVFSSCSKQYNPDEKIVKITYKYHYSCDDPTVPDVNQSSEELWTWEKERLTQIKYNDMMPLEFVYDGKKLLEIKWNDGSYSFSYHNQKLEKIEMYSRGSLIVLVTVNYKNSMVTELSYQEFATPEKESEELLARKNALTRTILPFIQERQLMSCREDAASRKETSFSFDLYLEYSNDNVTKQRTVYANGEEEILTFEYDQNENPFYSAFHALENYEMSPVFFSKNNIISSYNQTLGEEGKKYQYEYKDKWPVRQSSSEIWLTERFDWDLNVMVPVGHKIEHVFLYDYQ